MIRPLSLISHPLSLSSMSLAFSDELAQNTAALARVLDALLSLSEEQRQAASEVNEARLQAIFDERQELMKTLEELLLSRQQWRDDVTQTGSLRHGEKACLLASLARDNAALSEKAQQAQRLAHEAETTLRSTVQGIGAQLQAQRRREEVMRAYHPSSPLPRFVDRVNVS